jgi:hypothetical protein
MSEVGDGKQRRWGCLYIGIDRNSQENNLEKRFP